MNEWTLGFYKRWNFYYWLLRANVIVDIVIKIIRDKVIIVASEISRLIIWFSTLLLGRLFSCGRLVAVEWKIPFPSSAVIILNPVDLF